MLSRTDRRPPNAGRCVATRGRRSSRHTRSAHQQAFRVCVRIGLLSRCADDRLRGSPDIETDAGWGAAMPTVESFDDAVDLDAGELLPHVGAIGCAEWLLVVGDVVLVSVASR